MNRYINDFLRYFRENRAKLFRWFFIAVAVLILILLIRYAVEQWQSARYDRRVEALEKEIGAADAKAKDAEARAAGLRDAIEDKYLEIVNLRSRAEIAEDVLRDVRRATAPLKEAHEKTRVSPDIPIDISCADACARLAALGHSCDQ